MLFLLLSGLLLGQSVVVCPLTALAGIFPDTRSHWASPAIHVPSEQSILTGYSDGMFRPDGAITRAEFSVVMVKALALTLTAGGAPVFQDVPTDHWAYPAIETARVNGFVCGYPTGLFLPEKPVSRAEALAMLAAAARIPVPDDTTIQRILGDYRDAKRIPGWARPGVAAVIRSGLYISNPAKANILDPLKPATRADVAALAQRLRENVDLLSLNTSPSVSPEASPGASSLPARVATIPANTRFVGTMSGNAISSESAQVGDPIVLYLDQSISSPDRRILIPSGSKIMGKIIAVEPAYPTDSHDDGQSNGQSGGSSVEHGELDIRFIEIVTPDHQRYEILATVATEDGALHAGDAKGRVPSDATDANLTVSQESPREAAMGLLSTGTVSPGGVSGGATCMGALDITRRVAPQRKVGEIILRAGDKLELNLDRPMTVLPVSSPEDPQYKDSYGAGG